MVVGCGFTLLSHQSGVQPIYGIILIALNTMSILSVFHNLARPASSLDVYLRVDGLSKFGATQMVHLSDPLQIRLLEELGKIVHKSVAGALTSLYQRKGYVICPDLFLLTLRQCRAILFPFPFLRMLCKVLRRGLVIAALRKMLTPSDIVCQRIPCGIDIISETMRSPTSGARVAAVSSAVFLKLPFIIVHNQRIILR